MFSQAVKKSSNSIFDDTYSNKMYRSKQIYILSPYQNKTSSYKGQLHSHSTYSGTGHTITISDLVTAYKNDGYNFISVTDHDTLGVDPGISGILYIQGVESEPGINNREHVTTVGVTKKWKNIETQALIDSANVNGYFIMLSHPRYIDSTYGINWKTTELESKLDYYAVDVWDSFVDSVNSTEGIIDTLLTKGKRFYLTAVDDRHTITGAHGAFVEVFANSLTSTEIIPELKKGNFYSSNGALITAINVMNGIITVTVPSSSTIEFIGTKGVILQTSSSVLSASYTVNGSEKYVRIRVTNSLSKKAWSNPIYVNTLPDEKTVTVRENLYLYGRTFSNLDAPQAGIHFSGKNELSTDNYGQFFLDRYWSFNAGGAPTFTGRKARGSFRVPTALQSGDAIVYFAARGYGATAFSTGGRGFIGFYAAENWTDAAQGTIAKISGTPKGTTAATVISEFGYGTDVDQTYITVKSPNGTVYYITVSDAGTLSASSSAP